MNILFCIYSNTEHGYIHTWLGANDFQEGRWQWVSELSMLTFTDWLNNQPDNSRGNEDCLNIQEHLRYGWNDIHCSNLFNYVCEKVSLNVQLILNILIFQLVFLFHIREYLLYSTKSIFSWCLLEKTQGAISIKFAV